MKRWIVLSAFGLAISLTQVSVAQGFDHIEGVVISNTAALERAYEEGMSRGREFALLESELAAMIGSGNRESMDQAAGWVTSARKRLTPSEQEKLIRLCMRGDTPASVREGLRAALVDLRWRQSSREERRKIYWDAVKLGTASIWEGVELDRIGALVRAVEEGLDEFAPAVREHAAEVDVHLLPGGIRPSDVNLLTLRLRAGAKDREDGLRREGSQLEAIDDEEFSRAMSNDPVFQYVGVMYAESACRNTEAEACLAVGRIALRQERAWSQTQQRAEVSAGGGPVGNVGGPMWLSQLREAAAPGVERIRLEDAKSRRAAGAASNK